MGSGKEEIEWVNEWHGLVKEIARKDRIIARLKKKVFQLVGYLKNLEWAIEQYETWRTDEPPMDGSIKRINVSSPNGMVSVFYWRDDAGDFMWGRETLTDWINGLESYKWSQVPPLPGEE